MTTAVFLGERLIGIGQEATLVYQPGSTWTIKFESDRPVTNEQFFAFADTVAKRFPGDVITAVPIDQTHFEVTLKFREMLEPGDFMNESEEINGVVFTATGAYSGAQRTPVEGSGMPVEEEKKKKLSTGAMLGIGAAVIVGSAGVGYYFATRKPKRRRRRR